jgi:glycosyltransferase involved in cell wall biosynthesis
VRTRADARSPRPRPGQGWLLRRTAGLIVANRAILRGLEGAPLPAARAVIHQGIALNGEFAPGPPPARAIAGLLGRLDPVKGHRVLLEAAALAAPKAPGLRIRIAGADANLRRTDLEAQARALGVDGIVAFEGRAPSAGDFVRGCSFGLIPSLGSEAVSRAALEWMAAGRCVAASRVGALPELIEDGVTGLLVPPADPAALAEALVRLAANPLAGRLGDSARRRVEERFGLERFVAATLELYDKALSSRKAAAR